VENEHNGLLVDSGDTEQLTIALQRLICDSALRQQFGLAGSKKVHAQFEMRNSFSSLEAKLIALLKS